MNAKNCLTHTNLAYCLTRMRKAQKSVQRVGTLPVKILFKVESKNLNNCLTHSIKYFVAVRYLTIAKCKEVTAGTQLSVCFERGGKLASSKDILPTESHDGTWRVDYNECLSLVATLYRDSSGNYQVR